jgi:hypothetical protein
LTIGRFVPGRRPWQPTAGTMASGVLCAHAAVLLLLYYMAGYISHRHVIPMVTLLLPMTGAGLLWIAERLAWLVRVLRALESPSHRLLRAAQRFAELVQLFGRPRVALAAVALVVAAGLLPKTLNPMHKADQTIVEAAQWIRTHSQPGETVLSTSAYVRFYAQRFGAVLGSEAPNLTSGLAVAPESQLWTFLVLAVNERTLDRQQLKLLEAAYQPQLDLAAHPRKTWLRVLVYRLKSAPGVRLADLPAAPK